jgi:hypothetical protein
LVFVWKMIFQTGFISEDSRSRATSRRTARLVLPTRRLVSLPHDDDDRLVLDPVGQADGRGRHEVHDAVVAGGDGLESSI